MTIDKLRKIHQTQPFQPFTLERADGNKVQVPHSEFLAYHPRGRMIAVAMPDEAIKMIDVMLVLAIEVGNGQAKEKPQ